MFRLPAPFAANLDISLTSLLASLKQFSQSYWDAVSWAWSPKQSHQIKELSTSRLQLYFLVDNVLFQTPEVGKGVTVSVLRW